MRHRLLLLVTSAMLLAGCAGLATGPEAGSAASPTRLPLAQLPPTETASPRALPPTYTPLPSATITPTPTPSATPTVTPSATPTPSVTPTPFPYAALDETLSTPETAVPTPVPTLAVPGGITLIALLGNDNPNLTGGRTDSMILVAVDRRAQTATLLSLPRDLYVPVPGWQMARLNQVFPHGGRPLLNDTLLWSFGLPVDHTVRVGFDGFKQLIDALGGVEMAVTCPLRDWRLKSPELDPAVEENWEQFTLEAGVHQMDGELALWYARSRRTTSDFERGRRQQQVLRAMADGVLNQNLLPQLPQLWETYRGAVTTDLTLPALLELAALAPAARANGIRHLTLPYAAFQSWTVPSSGAAVQLLQHEAAAPTLAQLLAPGGLARAERPISVEIISANEAQYRLAAENLAWLGLQPRLTYTSEPDPAVTTISLHAPNDKGAYAYLVAWAFDRRPADVQLLGDADYPATYTVRLGADFNPCRPLLAAPRP